MKPKKEKVKLAIYVALFLILILLGASIIGDVLFTLLKDKINQTALFLINVIIVFMFIILILKTKTVKTLEKNLIKNFKRIK